MLAVKIAEEWIFLFQMFIHVDQILIEHFSIFKLKFVLQTLFYHKLILELPDTSLCNNLLIRCSICSGHQFHSKLYCSCCRSSRLELPHHHRRRKTQRWSRGDTSVSFFLSCSSSQSLSCTGNWKIYLSNLY